MEMEIIIRLVISGILGALIGLEREIRYKEAGLRTHFVVAVGSALGCLSLSTVSQMFYIHIQLWFT